MTTTTPDGVRAGTPRRVRWAVRTAAAGAVLVAAGFAVASLGWSSRPYTTVETLGPDRLRVTWGGGACDDAWWLDVDESDDAVRITVRTQVLARSCTDIEVARSAVVVLDRALAGRTVVNAACERAEFATRTECQDL